MSPLIIQMERADARCYALKFEEVVKSAQDAAVLVLVYRIWSAATRRRFSRRDMSRRTKARTCPRTPKSTFIRGSTSLVAV